MLKYPLILLFLVAYVWAAKPMEPLNNYNVILVHGAADKRSGLDCAWASIGAAYDFDWFWENGYHGGNFLFQFESSGATGMVNELNEWLTENIFHMIKGLT